MMTKYFSRLIIFLVRAFIDVFLIWPQGARRALLNIGFLVILISVVASWIACFSLIMNDARKWVLHE